MNPFAGFVSQFFDEVIDENEILFFVVVLTRDLIFLKSNKRTDI